MVYRCIFVLMFVTSISLVIPHLAFAVGDTQDYLGTKIAYKDRVDNALQEEKKINNQFDETTSLSSRLAQNQSFAFYALSGDLKNTIQKLKNDIFQLNKVDKSMTTTDKYLRMSDTTWHTIGPLIASNSPDSQIDQAIKDTNRYLIVVEHNQVTNHAILDDIYSNLEGIYDQYYGKMDGLENG